MTAHPLLTLALFGVFLLTVGAALARAGRRQDDTTP